MIITIQAMIYFLQILARNDVTSVDQNVKISLARRLPKGDKCRNFRPKRANWGIRRITCPDPITGLKPWPCYRYEPEMDVDIYIVDSGILTTHEEFQEKGESRAECLFATDDVGGVCVDDDGHGTHVAGVASGKKFGVAKEASVIGVKVLGKEGGTGCGVIAGLRWIQRRVNGNNRPSVINMSLGTNIRWAPLDNAVKSTLGENIPVVVAAGNAARDACLESPAAVGGVGGDAITVMASDRNDIMYTLSNCGTCTDIIAPGVKIKSAINTGTDQYDAWDGSSMATPFVAGLVARYLAQNNGKTPAELKKWITGSAAKDLITVRANCPAGTPNLLVQSGCYL